MNQNNAIAEEVDYSVDGLYIDEDYDQRGGIQHQNGMQIMRKPKFSAVRLKHNESRSQSGSVPRAVTHSVSHGAGVLLGNLTQYQGGHNNLINNQNQPRELNDSKTFGNLKSVYDMRVSHSNLGYNGAGRPPKAIKVTKAKRMQSAMTRGHNKTQQNMTMEQTIATNSHNQINGLKKPGVEILRNMSSSYYPLAQTNSRVYEKNPVRLSQTI